MIRRAARSASSQAFDALSHHLLGCGEHLSVGLNVDVDSEGPHDREGTADGEHRLHDSINTPEELVGHSTNPRSPGVRGGPVRQGSPDRPVPAGGRTTEPRPGDGRGPCAGRRTIHARPLAPAVVPAPCIRPGDRGRPPDGASYPRRPTPFTRAHPQHLTCDVRVLTVVPFASDSRGFGSADPNPERGQGGKPPGGQLRPAVAGNRLTDQCTGERRYSLSFEAEPWSSF